MCHRVPIIDSVPSSLSAKPTSHSVKASTLQIDDAPVLYLPQAEKKLMLKARRNRHTQRS